MEKATIDAEACISCGNCAGYCPAEAIYEGDDTYAINQSLCVGCGSCLDACPVSAITLE